MAKKKKNTKGSSGMNRKLGEEFLDKNRRKADVFETASGLQYTIIEEGNGEMPFPDDRVLVNQRITHLDGTAIADTYRTGEKDEFSIAEAIDGLREGLQLMKTGARWKFFVPHELAWGKRGAGSKIGPYSTLIFDIRLEKLNP